MEREAREGLARIGKYRLLGELGRGGMGVVYLAEDSRLQRQVALKILHPFLSMDEEFVRRFTSEAQAIAALSHRGIVRVHAFEEVDGSHLIDMEYIEGQSLDKFLGASRCGTGQALAIATRAFEALAACHARGIIHRDVKPSNILLANDGRVLISDFGLARSCALLSSASASSSCFIGTPKYAAPESWGKSSATPAGDVYSAGLVLLELLAGQTPFDGDSPLEIMRKMLAAPRIDVRGMVPDASNELVSSLQAMLDADPARRPANASEAVQRLRETPECRQLPDDRSETIRVTPPHLRGSTANRRSRLLVGATTGVILTLVAAFAIAWRPPRPSETAVTEPAPTPGTVAETPTRATSPPVAPSPAFLAATGNFVVFAANSGDWRSLWSYDTSTGETTPLWPELSLQPDDDLFCPYPVKGGIVALVRSDTNGMTLFFTDGTPGHTTPLAFAASRLAHRIEVLAARDGHAWFNRIGGDGTLGLWATDGTLASTRHIWGDTDHPIFDDVAVSPGGHVYFGSIATRTLHVLPAGQQEPIHLGPADVLGAEVVDLVNVGEGVLAELNDGKIGRELYAADAATGSLRLVREFMPGSAHGLIMPQFARFGALAVFVAQTPEHGLEPWLSDGTPEGTRLLADVNPGAGASNPNRFTESGGRMFFSAQTHTHGRELWVSDGTSEGTRLVADIAPGIDSGEPHDFIPFNDGLLFSARDGAHGEELWFSDGTAEGTRLVRDCVPGEEGGEPFKGVMINGRAWFSAVAPGVGRTLWQSDGTAEGTRPVLQRLESAPAPIPPPAAWTQFQNRIYVATVTPELGAEPWITDPVSGESQLLRDIHPGPEGSNPRDFFGFNDELYFVADDGIHGAELWRTDGTESGTTLAYDALPDAGSGAPRDFVANERGFAFIANKDNYTSVYIYRPHTRDFHVVRPPDHHNVPWVALDLRLGATGGYEFTVQTPSGETTLWHTWGDAPARIPGLGGAQ